MNDAATDITNALLASTELSTSSVTDAPRIPGKRGRPAETLAQRELRLERQLAETRVAKKEAERRMFMVAAEALLAEADADSAFKARVVEILRRRVTTAAAKSDIAALLAG